MSDISTPEQATMSRRTFLRRTALTGAALSLAILAPPSTPTSEIITQEIDDQEIFVTRALHGKNTPLTNTEHQVFNLQKNQWVTPNSLGDSTGLVLGKSSFPPQWSTGRDIQITPEFLTDNQQLQDVLIGSNQTFNMWTEKLQAASATVDYFNVIDDSARNTVPNVGVKTSIKHVSVPTDLLQLKATTSALAKELTYKFYETDPDKFEALPLSTRLELGYTNCIEFSLLAAAAFSRAGYPSEIMYFGFDHPKKGPLYHVANVLSINNCAVIANLTSGQELYTFHEFMRNYKKANLKMHPQIQIASILADNSYQHFPWDNEAWILGETSLSIIDAYKSSIQ